MSKSVTLLVTLSLVGFLAACSSDHVPTGVSSSPWDPSGSISDLREVAAQVIEASGGALSTEQARFEVPEGALTTATRIQMTASSVNGETVCEMLPHGQQFREGCTISFRKPAGHDPNTIYRVFWLNEDTMEWEEIGGDTNGDWVSTKISHFSKYKVSERKPN